MSEAALCEHVVERDGRVGQDDALGRRVRDVALVPERDVLEPDDRVAAHHARHPAQALRQDRVALVRHRRRSLLPLLETLLRLAHFRPLPVANLQGELLDATRRRSASVDRYSAYTSRWMTCVETGAAFSPRRAQTRSSTSGSRCANAPTAPLILPTATASRALSSRARLRRISSYQSAKVRPNEVGSAWTPCVRPTCGVSLELEGATLQHFEQRVRLREQQVAGVAQQQGVGRVHHVRRGEPVVDEARGLADFSASAVVKAITSWSVVFSISRMRSTVKAALALDLFDGRRAGSSPSRRALRRRRSPRPATSETCSAPTRARPSRAVCSVESSHKRESVIS